MAGRVAFLGPLGTFTHQAVLALRPDAEPQPLGSAAEALDAVGSGAAEQALVPIDNSVNGVVVPTLDALVDRPHLSIIDSVVVPISFDAFTRDPSVEPHVVVSHPHALAQCRAWIEARHLPTREASSTAGACRDLGPGEIALGPAVCGELYDLQTVQRAVEDHTAAHTQFALVSASPLPGAGEGDDGLIISLIPPANVPGILRRLLGVLEDRGVNMTNLVTRPMPATPGLFRFMLFLSGRFDSAEVEAMAAEWSELGATARAIGRIAPLHELAGR